MPIIFHDFSILLCFLLWTFFCGKVTASILRITIELHACMPSCFSHVRFFANLWTVAHQPPLSMGFSRKEYWSGLPFSPPGNLPDSGIKPASPVTPALQADSLPLSHRGTSRRRLERVAYPFSRGSFWPRVEPGYAELQVDSLPAELPWKPPGLG